MEYIIWILLGAYFCWWLLSEVMDLRNERRAARFLVAILTGQKPMTAQAILVETQAFGLDDKHVWAAGWSLWRSRTLEYREMSGSELDRIYWIKKIQ
ncbi:hypothetical protein HQ487_05550 [Candidatus Uhrbacteria bacterium]|nr:hypothetical protein [Candidatus Uhrbacteria bacterium]